MTKLCKKEKMIDFLKYYVEADKVQTSALFPTNFRQTYVGAVIDDCPTAFVVKLLIDLYAFYTPEEEQLGLFLESLKRVKTDALGLSTVVYFPVDPEEE